MSLVITHFLCGTAINACTGGLVGTKIYGNEQHPDSQHINISGGDGCCVWPAQKGPGWRAGEGEPPRQRGEAADRLLHKTATDKS